MKKLLMIIAVVSLVAGVAVASNTGEELYKKKCAMCHPKGGNIMKADKTLQKASLEAAGIASVEGIVGKMRNPGKGMPKYDVNSIPEADAKAIAEYVLTTFK